MSSRPVNCGYVPLVDSAPLIIAKELGFAEDEGIALNLLRQPSWSALRDLLALEHLDVAHMLSPMPVAMSLGLSGSAVQIDAPLVLSVNGTVIGVSLAVAETMRAQGWVCDIRKPAETIAHVLRACDNPLRIGVPFPFSMHRLLLEYLIRDLRPEETGAITTVTTPPVHMARAVADGEIDMFCVGEPWGTVAVSSGAGELILPGCAIWAHAPEKVLGMRRQWAHENEETCAAIMRACLRAGRWLEQTGNQPLASEILARSEHLDLPDPAIDPALSGHLHPRADHSVWRVPNFVKFYSGATSFPWRSQGAWIGAQISRLHGLDAAQTIARAAECQRPDLYRRYLGQSGADLPGASAKVEGAMAHETAVASTKGDMILGPDAFFDGETFDFGPLEPPKN